MDHRSGEPMTCGRFNGNSRTQPSDKRQTWQSRRHVAAKTAENYESCSPKLRDPAAWKPLTSACWQPQMP